MKKSVAALERKENGAFRVYNPIPIPIARTKIDKNKTRLLADFFCFFESGIDEPGGGILNDGDKLFSSIHVITIVAKTPIISL